MGEVSHIPADTRYWERWPQSEVQLTDTPRPPQGAGVQGKLLGASVKVSAVPSLGKLSVGWNVVSCPDCMHLR